MTLRILFFVILFQTAFGQEERNEFFTFLNMMDGDTISVSMEHKISYIQSVGYSGLGFELNDDFEQIHQNLEDYSFKSSICVLKIDMDEPNLDNSLKDYFKLLKGSKCIIAPSFYSKSNYLEHSKKGDDRVKKLCLEIAQLARKGNLGIAIYPRFGYYVQSHNHAYEISKDIAKLNIGYCFNLSDWLATEGMEERNHIKSQLMESISKIKAVTINGANKVITQKANIWDDYILPLGEGSFDTLEFVEFLVKKLKYSGPIGVQCEGLKGDKMQMAEDIMLVWKSYLAEMDMRY